MYSNTSLLSKHHTDAYQERGIGNRRCNEQKGWYGTIGSCKREKGDKKAARSASFAAEKAKGGALRKLGRELKNESSGGAYFEGRAAEADQRKQLIPELRIKTKELKAQAEKIKRQKPKTAKAAKIAKAKTQQPKQGFDISDSVRGNPTGQILRLPTKFISDDQPNLKKRSKAKPSALVPEALDALKASGRNITQVFAVETGPDQYKAVAGSHVLAGAKSLKLDFSKGVIVTQEMARQLESEMTRKKPMTTIERTRQIKQAKQAFDEAPSSKPSAIDSSISESIRERPTGQILREGAKFITTASDSMSRMPMSASAIANLKKTGTNVLPVYVREKQNGAFDFEVVANGHVLDAIRKAGLPFAKIVVVDRQMEAQLRLEELS